MTTPVPGGAPAPLSPLDSALFESSPDCVKLLDLDGRLLAMNRNGRCAMELGDFAPLMGALWSSLWPAESGPAIAAAIASARAGEVAGFKAFCPTARGAPKWWEVTVTPIKRADGTVAQLLSVSRDITATVAAGAEREALLRQIQAANERMQDVFRQAPAVMCVLRGPEHVFEMVNERFAALTGRTGLLGKPVRAALPEVAGQGFFELLDQVYRSGEPFSGADMPITFAAGRDPAPRTRYLDFVYMALRDADGRISGILAHGVDMTERVRATEELRASEERYRTLFKSMDQGFCIIEMLFDENGAAVDYRFLEMNPVFERHTGLEDAAGRTAREVVPALDRFWIDTYGRVAASGQPVRFEQGDAAMGRWFDVYATRLGGPGSARVALLFSDISERKRADESLRKLAADLALSDRRKTEFLATLAHELRNPLAPIRNGLALLRMHGAGLAPSGRIVDVMDRQVSSMVRLIDDLLDIARISGGKLELKKERVRLQPVLANAIETSLPLIEAGRHAFEADMGEPLVLEIDPTRIGQVIANLLNNAAKYTPAGGHIALTVRRGAHEVRIEVADSGIGIPAESLESVFDMFNQVGAHTDRSHGGLGIGLSLVRRLVELHGGSVVAASAGPGLGSTFTVRLPLGAGALTPAPPQAAAAPGPAVAGLKILVVDDNVDAATTLGMLFEAGGHAVRLAHDGHQGLACARAFRPDVAFLDIGMPGMDGYQTARALRGERALAGTILVALTGWGTESDRLQSASAGFDLHLTKPVDMAAVGEILAGVRKRGV